MSRQSGFSLSPQILIGIFLIALGVLITLDNLDIVETRAVLRYWPLAMILIGITMLMPVSTTEQEQLSRRESRRRQTSRTTGWVLVIVGSWIMLDRFDVIDLHFWEMFWPLVFMTLGGGLIWQAVKRNRRRAVISANEDTSLTGIMSGSKHRWDAKPFRHADITAFWGGTELDLRKATLANGEEAVVDVFAMMGGHEIQVPEGWNVICEIQPILGGVDDKTDAPIDSNAPRLVLKGLIVMGGVSVKH